MQIQISWLLQKPTDLDLHCLLRQGMSCSAREGLMLNLLGKKLSRWNLGLISIFPPENRLWYYIQTISFGNNLHEKSRPVFWGEIISRSTICRLRNLHREWSMLQSSKMEKPQQVNTIKRFTSRNIKCYFYLSRYFLLGQLCLFLFRHVSIIWFKHMLFL